MGLFAQSRTVTSTDIIYVNPANGSVYNNPETTITIGFRKQISVSLLEKCNILIKDIGGQFLKGDLVQPSNRTLLIFKPKKELDPKQTYFVDVIFDQQPICQFNFYVDEGSKESLTRISYKALGHPRPEMSETDRTKARIYRKQYGLPESFPAIEIINSNRPGGGYYFLNRINQVTGVTFFLIIMDTLGFPVYYKKIEPDRVVNNFSMQETGYLSYWDQTDRLYYIIDSSYNVINSYGAKNGYLADGHELVLKDDGTYWVMIYDDRIVDMSEIVPGGQESAIVTGLVIQHIDEGDNVLFEWKSWDHFQISDADSELVTLSAQHIDYVHGNAMDFDSDNNLLLSSRNLSEITKVDVATGEVIWRWGGTQNQFEFVDDSLMFSAQHNIRSLGNNVYSLFDNGNGRDVPFSRGLYYELDTGEYTATLLTNYNKFDSLVFAPFMGSFFTSESEERVIGWSYNLKRYVVTEYDSTGNVLLEIRSVDTAGLMSYRAEKWLWGTNAITFDRNEVFIEDASLSDTMMVEFELTNNLSDMYNLNGFNSSDSSFKLLEELPIAILPGETKVLHLIFLPQEVRRYEAAISLFTDNQTRRIAKQFRISTSEISHENEFVINNSNLRVSPNPSGSSFQISSSGTTKIENISVFNLSGQNLMVNATVCNSSASFNVNNVPAGLYLLKIETNLGTVIKRIIVE